MKKIIILLCFLILCPVALSLDLCQDQIEINTNCTMLTPVLRNCQAYNYTIINNTGGIAGSGNLSVLSGDIYYFNFTLGEGDYIVKLCDGTTRETKVTDRGDSMIIGIIILLPLILSFILLIGAFSLDPETHSALKIFLFLLSIIPFFASLHLGLMSVVKFYNFTAMQELIGSITWWVGLAFGVIVTYFIIYLFYVLVQASAQQKKERLQY